MQGKIARFLFLALLLFPVKTHGIDCSHEFVAGTEVIRSAHGAIVFKEENRELDIISIQVDEKFRGIGQGTLLYQQMFLRHPNVHTLRLFIMWDNLAAWMRASGTCEERYEATPSSKIERLFGFGLVTVCEPGRTGVYIEVTRGGELK